jgi:hypothetical protein
MKHGPKSQKSKPLKRKGGELAISKL